MVERRALGQLGREPLYNTQAVAQRAGVPADTFRAWERRYGLPKPQRAPGNRRLYSERDIGVISWLRDRTAEGMGISQAIQRLKLEHPEVAEPLPPPARADPSAGPVLPRLAALGARLVDAAGGFDARAGERVLDEAFALASVEEACWQVLQPALADIGARRERGELRGAQERFVRLLVARRLATVFDLVAPVAGRGTAIVAGAPTERDEVGVLLLAILLARRGWEALVLGAAVPVEDLLDAARQVRPDLVCLSVATADAVPPALAAAQQLRATQLPPAVAYGGLGFDAAPGGATLPGVARLAGDPDELAARIEALVQAGAGRSRLR